MGFTLKVRGRVQGPKKFYVDFRGKNIKYEVQKGANWNLLWQRKSYATLQQAKEFVFFFSFPNKIPFPIRFFSRPQRRKIFIYFLYLFEKGRGMKIDLACPAGSQGCCSHVVQKSGGIPHNIEKKVNTVACKDPFSRMKRNMFNFFSRKCCSNQEVCCTSNSTTRPAFFPLKRLFLYMVEGVCTTVIHYGIHEKKCHGKEENER